LNRQLDGDRLATGPRWKWLTTRRRSCGRREWLNFRHRLEIVIAPSLLQQLLLW
jgi:hypothetical protein